MAANASFSTYSPPTPPKGTINVTIGIFFDGTRNNKNNTNERIKNTSDFKNNGASKAKDTSYYNDHSNVARLFEYLTSSTKIYVEGIGTTDKKGDSTIGFGLGSGDTGIRAKVRKGCESIATIVKSEKSKSGATKIGTLTLDVFGFSRGAAAARNFVHEISKAKYQAKLNMSGGGGNYGGGSTYLTDSDGYITKRKEFPRRGHLGLKLEESSLQVDIIRVRFLGIFDTVSSYSTNLNPKPNFNDVVELSLNNIGAAANVVHYVAENEHRENFSLTNTHVGVTKVFPGVHSDIGGSYNDGLEIVEEIETSKLSKNKLNPLIESLIADGWYKREQLKITGGIVYWALEGRRELKKAYSYIPLHFMAESSKSKAVNFNREALEKAYAMDKISLLVRVKAKLRTYVFGSGKQYLLNSSLSAAERKDLLELRNKFLHWSAKREGIGMDPNSNRKRVYY